MFPVVCHIYIGSVSPPQVCTGSVHQSGTTWSQRSGNARFHILDISRDTARLCSATDRDCRHCETEGGDSGHGWVRQFDSGSNGAAEMEMLPCFTVGFDMLSCTEDFTAVHTSAVVHRNTVAVVILKLVMWTVTTTLAGRVGTLEVIPGANTLIYIWLINKESGVTEEVYLNDKKCKEWMKYVLNWLMLQMFTYQWFAETVTGFLSCVNWELWAVNTNLPIFATWCKQWRSAQNITFSY